MKRGISLLLVFSLLLLPACKKVSKEWTEQFELGSKYLTDGNYQEAILSFTAAIDSDANLPDAYIGRADAYIAAAAKLADGGVTPGTEQSRQIIACLQQAMVDYGKALDLVLDGCESATPVDILQEKRDQTAERLAQITEVETAARTTPEPDESVFDEAYMAETQQIVDSAMVPLAYSLILYGLDNMGAVDTEWMINDEDGDSTPELWISTMLAPFDIWSRTYFFADADNAYLEGRVIDGMAIRHGLRSVEDNGQTITVWQTGGATSSGSMGEILHRIWDGTQWLEYAYSEWRVFSNDSPDQFAKIGTFRWNGQSVSPEDFDALSATNLSAESPHFGSPDLSAAAVSGDWAYVLPALDHWITSHFSDYHSVSADLNGDGQEEQIYLIRHAADLWFDNAVLESGGYIDYHPEDLENFPISYRLSSNSDAAVAIVASQNGEQVLLRTVNLGSWSGAAPQLTANGLILDDNTYVYQQNGTALIDRIFVETPANLVDGTYTISIYEDQFLETAEGLYAVVDVSKNVTFSDEYVDSLFVGGILDLSPFGMESIVIESLERENLNNEFGSEIIWLGNAWASHLFKTNTQPWTLCSPSDVPIMYTVGTSRILFAKDAEIINNTTMSLTGNEWSGPESMEDIRFFFNSKVFQYSMSDDPKSWGAIRIVVENGEVTFAEFEFRP